ncbi:putative sensor-like histidine kinase [Lysobacter capsici AZ78]|uniref:Sensor-like histidine kinase n=1 Tax=Lysobacter capsici AZ78 TaxID=1444315 RepID=A0A108U7D7_9GAMM|nr:putative sensor-like histidine kinase [Lysobacter capsici AZ78]
MQTAFKVANAQLGGHWSLVPEQQADFVVVDMDSMYGPMSWLRLHASGKSVIALTAAQRTQADHLLAHPFSADSMATLLGEIATLSGHAIAKPAPAAAPTAIEIPKQPRTDPTAALPDVVVDLLETDLAQAKAAAQQSAPAPVAVPPAEAVVPAPAAPAPVAPAPVAAAPAAPAAPVAAAPAVANPAVPSITARGDGLLDWLVAGRLRGLLRVGSGEERLLIDADQRKYHGPAALKPLAGLFDRGFAPSEFELLPAAQWDSAAAQLGAPMPLARLVWFGNLLAGHGRLAPGYDPQRRYRMTKWPQTEREYPKHFRIATVMMKAPSTVTEIAEASGVTEAEVADFINANLATGFAEAEGDPTPAEPAKSGGLFGRLRGR